MFAAAVFGRAARRAVQTRESLAGLLTAKRRAFTPRARPAAAEEQSAMPWQSPDASTESAARLTAALAQPRPSPAGGEAHPAAVHAKAPAPGLSDLRRRMATRERPAPGAPGSTPSLGPTSRSAAGAPPARQDAATPKPDAAVDLGAREFTSRLLAKKKQRGGGG